jgi:1,4-alpha-glucan branching enzyme
MVEASGREQQQRDPKRLRLLKQAARELLLAQSSDWSFILRAGTTTELARERIHRHLDRFWRLLELLKPNHCCNEKERIWLDAVEQEDFLFPLVEPSDWLAQ